MEIQTKNNLTFGAKVPTKNVLGLASNRNLYNGAWDDNIRTIENLAGKGCINESGMGIVVAFEAVGKAFKKLFPELELFLKDIEKLRYIRVAKRDEKINKIFKTAEEKFGKEMEVPEEVIKKVVKANNSPIGAYINGNLY